MDTLDFEFVENGIASLSAFGNLDTVGRNVLIEDNPLLESLDNLIPNSLGKDLTLKNNASLTDVEALLSISEVPEDFIINNNDALTNLDGAANLNKVESLTITRNNSLSDLSGFQSLDTIQHNLSIWLNGGIADMTGFSALVSVEYLRIGTISFLNSGRVGSLNGLQGLTSLKVLEIFNSDDLTSLEGMQNVTQLESIFIYDADVLTDLTGLENVDTLGSCTIFQCSGLESLNGLNGLQYIKNEFLLHQNKLVTDCFGLENLRYVNSLMLSYNNGLTSFAGLENLQQIDSILEIRLNYNLIDISAIGNVNMVDHLDSLNITSDTLLSVCTYDNICDYLMMGGVHVISGNNTGCGNLNEVIDACLANTDQTRLQGKVWGDLNLDCATDSDDVDIADVLLRVQNNTYDYTFSADSTGYYDIPVLAGEYTLSVISPSAFWIPCFEDTLITALALNDTIVTDFYLQPEGDCPYIDWTMNLTPLRICGTRTATLDLCNLGAQPAEDILFTIELDEYVTLDSASVSYTTTGSGAILITVDSLDLFECNTIELFLFTDCDSVEINEVLCVNVDLMGDELCAPNSLWDGSTTKVTGYCENDSIYFLLENVGTGNMLSPAEFKVEILIEDIVLLHDGGSYQLQNGESTLLVYKTAGNGFHLSADQTEGHPVSTSAMSTVPNCEEILNDLVLTLFPNNNGDPFSETFCTFAINSYDPNAKLAFPRGVGEEHFIEKDWQLDYTIQFQNTGNDVAYQVVIRDTLSENLDLTTLRVHGASHDFTWSLNAERELVFTFANILLPDSTSNEPASHGLVSYSISPSPDILPLERIENLAGIYFDFNEPIITNTVFHTIRKPVVTTSLTSDWCAGTNYNGVPIWNDTTILQVVEFVEYDSAHVAYLQIADTLRKEEFVEVLLGDVFENIEILNDTIFSISYTSQHGCDSIVIFNVSALAVGTSELENPFEQIRVFPNPATNVLMIDVPKNIKLQHWSLINPIGIRVWEKTLSASSSVVSVSLEKIPNGVYWLEATAKGDNKIWKIVVSK